MAVDHKQDRPGIKQKGVTFPIVFEERLESFLRLLFHSRMVAITVVGQEVVFSRVSIAKGWNAI